MRVHIATQWCSASGLRNNNFFLLVLFTSVPLWRRNNTTGAILVYTRYRTQKAIAYKSPQYTKNDLGLVWRLILLKLVLCKHCNHNANRHICKALLNAIVAYMIPIYASLRLASPPPINPNTLSGLFPACCYWVTLIKCTLAKHCLSWLHLQSFAYFRK